MGRWVSAVTLCLLVHGCETGTGGAVELSWKLRPDSSALGDKFVECEPGSDDPDRGTVTRIRLNWVVVDDHGVQVTDDHANDSDDWKCDDNHGVTKFALPAGTASLSVVPECASGESGVSEPADPRTYIAPAPVQRQVIQGNTISLGAVELVVSVSSCGQPAGSGTEQCICK